MKCSPDCPGAPACVVCAVDGFHRWLDERKARRRRYKQEWRETPVHERYDLGGEA